MSEKKEVIRDEDLPDEFWFAGSCSGGIVRTCSHGITFFHDSDRAGDWNEDELEELRRKSEKSPDKYVALDSDANSTSMFGHEWYWECGLCRQEAFKHLNFIWNNRHTISRYLNDRIDREAAQAKKAKRDLKIKLTP